MSEGAGEQLMVLTENWTDDDFWYTSLHFGGITITVQGRLDAARDETLRMEQARDLDVAVSRFHEAFWMLVTEGKQDDEVETE